MLYQVWLTCNMSPIKLKSLKKKSLRAHADCYCYIHVYGFVQELHPFRELDIPWDNETSEISMTR